jgi:hypothetical protein
VNVGVRGLDPGRFRKLPIGGRSPKRIDSYVEYAQAFKSFTVENVSLLE